MHSRKNSHRYLWLLSGTGEGPLLAAALIEQGWRVSVSVVSAQASLPYNNLSLENLWIGPLAGVAGIRDVLQEAFFRHNGFDLVVDATHPFAVVITADLHLICERLGQPLVRFERPLESPSGASFVSTYEDLSRQAFQGKNLLFALGARHLRQAVASARQARAKVFARVLPTPESLRLSLASGLPEHHLALSRPLQGQPLGELEAAICRRWSIDSVVCRQSGGLTQQLWQSICQKQRLDLWLISRPPQRKGLETFNNLRSLLHRASSSSKD